MLLSNIKISTKMLLCILIPILCALMLSIFLIKERYIVLKQTELLGEGVKLSSAISLLVHELQK